MGSIAFKSDVEYRAPQTRYRDPLPLAKELWDRVGARALGVAKSRAFECSSVDDSAGALLWEDVGRLLVRDHLPPPHAMRRLRYGASQ